MTFTITVNDNPRPFRPMCLRCGWAKGGPDSWDGKSCKCGFVDSPIWPVCDREHDLLSLAKQLTLNAAITLSHSAFDQGCVGRVFTGSGKYTTLAAIGVVSNLEKLGLIEERPLYADAPHSLVSIWTRLGIDLCQFITEHWDEISFRDPKRR